MRRDSFVMLPPFHPVAPGDPRGGQHTPSFHPIAPGDMRGGSGFRKPVRFTGGGNNSSSQRADRNPKGFSLAQSPVPPR